MDHVIMGGHCQSCLRECSIAHNDMYKEVRVVVDMRVSSAMVGLQKVGDCLIPLE